jgi:hypothetical protein
LFGRDLYYILFWRYITGVWTQGPHLVGRSSTTWIMSSDFFCFSYISDKVLHFCLSWPWTPVLLDLCLLYSWDYRNASPHLALSCTL